MFEMTANFTEVLGGLLFIVWALAGYRAGQLAHRRDTQRLGRAASRLLVYLGINTVLVLAQAALTILEWVAVDWQFAANRILLGVPVVLAPNLVVATLAVPRLRTLAAHRHDPGGTPVDSPTRQLAVQPRLVVPVQLAGVGGFLDFWVVMVDRPAPPSYPIFLLALPLLLLTVAALLTFRQYRAQHRPAQFPRWPSRVLHGFAGVMVISVAVTGLVLYGMQTSRLPDQLAMASMGAMDWGGGPQPHNMAMPGPHDHEQMGGAATAAVSVTQLTGDTAGAPDEEFTLVAAEGPVRLSSGKTVQGWAFNGQAPGPELRIREGDLVQVTVVNHLTREGVTVHWHGLDVPNAEDGVAGITQDAVQPGHSFVYRFRPHQVGTFWYHSHQASAEAVARGLFGALVVLPRTAGPSEAAAGLDLPVLAHSWDLQPGTNEAFGTADTLQRRAVPAGTSVRLRLINTSDNGTSDFIPRILSLAGTDAAVTAIDGTPLSGPTAVANLRIGMAIGGRDDIEFTMPDHVVRLTDEINPAAGLILSPSGTGTLEPVDPSRPLFDATRYGSPAATPFTAASHFDRSFKLTLDDGPGFYDGRLTAPPTINGSVFPNTPMLMVHEGDLVKTTIINRGHVDHPMHLHGHHALVLSLNHHPVTGSPWWTDTLEVQPGQIWEVAFRADNPGVWMDHCHNLQHAAAGMVMHLAYDNVTSPFTVGHATANRPE
jgi:FtsP/CotA-like multicopper oxidase with cupredoxin domain